jgi:ComF family protein
MKSPTGALSTDKAKPFSSSFFESALDLAFPRKCGLCGFFSPSPICGICEGEMAELDSDMQFRPSVESLDGWARVFAYGGRAGQAVRRLKHQRVTSLAEEMSASLWNAADRLECSGADMFIPVPIHWTRRCLRGFNQAELLCLRFPREQLFQKSLERKKATRPLAGLSPEQRRVSLAGAFRCRGGVEGAHIVLVDDVLTTGYTAMECARVLKEAGAASVFALSFTGA